MFYAAPFLLLSYMVVLLMVIDGGAEKVKDTENLIEDITDKLDGECVLYL